jgi:hypothetical protein
VENFSGVVDAGGSSCDLNMLCNCNWPCMTNEAEDRRGTCRNGISRSRVSLVLCDPFLVDDDDH